MLRNKEKMKETLRKWLKANMYEMLVDFYEITMSEVFIQLGEMDRNVIFDYFYRKNPDDRGYSIFAGLEILIEVLKDYSFNEEELEYLSVLGASEELVDYIRNMKLNIDMWAFEEGSIVFPNEPLITVYGPIVQLLLIETLLLTISNHETLIATKSSHISGVTTYPILEMGARRGHGLDGGVLGARAGYIGGTSATSNVLAGYLFDIPVLGTMSHAFVEYFDSEYEAFLAYAKKHPDNCVLLVDTYNVLMSGIPNAIRVAKEFLIPNGYSLKGVRLDSGDLSWLSIESEKMLREAGLIVDVIDQDTSGKEQYVKTKGTKIIASNSLDEITIVSLENQGSKIESYGVGERLIVSKSSPVFGGVYKLVAVEDKDNSEKILPRIKISENEIKITNPSFKHIYRLYDNETGKAIADVITLHDEVIDSTKPYELFDPKSPWKKKTITNFTVKNLRKKIFDKGNLVYEVPTIEEIKEKVIQEKETMWDSILRVHNPHIYHVDLSQKLYDLKQKMLEENKY